MYPYVDGGDRQKRFEACGNAFPTDHQAAVFLLEPGKRALGLEPGDHLFNRSAPVFLGLPNPLGNLGADTTLPELLTEGCGIIPFICCNDFEAFLAIATIHIWIHRLIVG